MPKNYKNLPKETGYPLLDLVNLLKWMQEHPGNGPSDYMVLEDGTKIIL